MIIEYVEQLKALNELAPIVATSFIWATYSWFKDKNHKDESIKKDEAHKQEVVMVHKEVENAMKEKTVAFMEREKQLMDLLIEERNNNNNLLLDFIKELRDFGEKLQNSTNSTNRLAEVMERFMLQKK